MLLLVLSFGFVSTGASESIVSIEGAVANPFNLPFDELIEMPRSTLYAELYYCWDELADSGYWTGVKLHLLLEEAEFNNEALSVKFHAEDGY